MDDYDHQYGETDLFERNLRWRGGTYLFGGLAALAALVCVGVIVLASSRFLSGVGQPADGFLTRSPAATQPGDTFVINTPLATLFLPTVTLGAPTPEPSATVTAPPTEGPCVQRVLPGDDLISIIFRCGHINFGDDLIQTVLEMNDLSDPALIQAGVNLQVPWPTATIDPNQSPEPTTVADSGAAPEVAAASNTGGDSSAGGGQDSAGLRLPPTETLQPGVIWHEVQPQENAISIAIDFGASLRILSELNPEIQFSQCDFGIGSGGPNCVVIMYPGQLIRVPAPTATPTIPPTQSGSETPTPTATPTFNQPSAISPDDLAFFGSNDLVTLRWISTGSLTSGQAYFVRVEDRTSQTVYTGTTSELFFILPEEWHGQDGQRHDYVWTVGVIKADAPDQPSYITEPRRFTWLGRGSQ